MDNLYQTRSMKMLNINDNPFSDDGIILELEVGNDLYHQFHCNTIQLIYYRRFHKLSMDRS